MHWRVGSNTHGLNFPSDEDLREEYDIPYHLAPYFVERINTKTMRCFPILACRFSVVSMNLQARASPKPLEPFDDDDIKRLFASLLVAFHGVSVHYQEYFNDDAYDALEEAEMMAYDLGSLSLPIKSTLLHVLEGLKHVVPFDTEPEKYGLDDVPEQYGLGDDCDIDVEVILQGGINVIRQSMDSNNAAITYNASASVPRMTPATSSRKALPSDKKKTPFHAQATYDLETQFHPPVSDEPEKDSPDSAGSRESRGSNKTDKTSSTLTKSVAEPDEVEFPPVQSSSIKDSMVA